MDTVINPPVPGMILDLINEYLITLYNLIEIYCTFKGTIMAENKVKKQNKIISNVDELEELRIAQIKNRAKQFN